MGRTSCAVRGCYSTKDGASSISFYRIFAGNRDVDEWISFCCNPSVTKNGMICCRHFKSSDFHNPNNKAQGVRYNARPSLFPGRDHETEFGLEEESYRSGMVITKQEDGLDGSYLASNEMNVLHENVYEAQPEGNTNLCDTMKIKQEPNEPEEDDSAVDYFVITVKEEIQTSEGDELTMQSITNDVKPSEEFVPAEIKMENHDTDFELDVELGNCIEKVEVKQEFTMEEAKVDEFVELEEEIKASGSDEIPLQSIIKNDQSEEDTVIAAKVEIHDKDVDSDIGIGDLTDTIEIKQELTIEEAKVEEYSELEQKRLKMSCKFCGFRCVTEKDFWTHVRSAHPEDRRTRCSICRVQFKGAKPLEKHIAEEHQGLEFECRICLVQLKKDQATKHKKECLGRLLYTCGICDKSYVKKEGLLKHLEEHDASEDRKNMSTFTRMKEQIFNCDICEDNRAYRKDPYWKHVKEQHDGHFIRCPDCRKTFTEHRLRFAHMKKQCKVGSARERFVAEQLKCPQCSKPFGSRAALDNHKIRYHAKKPFRCEVCGLEFSNWFNLRYHRIKIHSEPSLSCSLCEQKFHFDYTLRRHMALHQNERQILCDKCGLGFNSHSQLASHVAAHHQQLGNEASAKKQQIFQCEQCRKQFRLRTNYEKHVKLHDQSCQEDT